MTASAAKQGAAPPQTGAAPIPADKHLDVLLEIRDVLGEIRDRLPEPAVRPLMAGELPQMASEDTQDTEGGGDDDDEG
jgi:hypothetical protein